MPYFFFLWDGENDAKIAKHGITPEEFEEVVMGSWNTDISRSSGRPTTFGWTSGGRYLCCVYEIVDDTYCYPITAYEVEP